MKIVPKFQQGGSFDSLFVQYTPTETENPKLKTTSSAAKASKALSKDDDDTKGKLTEKDLFSMIGSVDGLPNEMLNVIGDLMATMSINKLLGNSQDLATTYLQSLYKIKLATLNKDKYEKVIDDARKNGTMAEPAITMGGNLIALDSKGNLLEITLDLFNKNRLGYKILSVSQLANLRAWDPKLTWAPDNAVFDIIDNSMSYENFEKLLDDGLVTLGTNSASKNFMDPKSKTAAVGLLILGLLSAELRVAVLSDAIEGKITEGSQAQQVGYLVSYLVLTLPDRAKTWAAIKMGISDKNEAAKKLIATKLGAVASNSKTSEMKYDQFYNWQKDWISLTNPDGKKSSDGTSGEPKEGFWRQVQSDKGGEDTRFTLKENDGHGVLSVDAKYYGGVPGLDHDKSLQQFITDSKVGALLVNSRSITFGNAKISLDSFNDVMIQASSGQMVATLPKNPDGTVNLSVVEDYQAAVDKVKKKGLKEGTLDYALALGKELKSLHLDILVDSQGLPNQKYFGHFLLLDGISSSKAKAVKGENKVSFDEFEDSPFIRRDLNAEQQLINGLSPSEKDRYDLDTKDWKDLWTDALSDLVYRGVVYIPINQNPINGFNADDNALKESQAYGYEKAMLMQQRRNNSSQLNNE